MVQLEKISFSYSKKKTLFDELNLELPSGNIYGLLGKNGAGKSTLLRMIAGLVFPNQGKVDVGGFRPMDRFPEFLSDIYLVPEEFNMPILTISQYIKLYSPFYPRFNHEMFDEVMNEFQLDKKQNLHNLSYGQKKKFLLSFGLATDCRLLILDEPTNGLDIPSKSSFRKVVANAIHEDRSFIISTHQARDMENLIDPIIILDEGKIVFHEDYESISAKLTLSKSKELPDNAIYSESVFGGYTILEENTTDRESNINLEVLFNAVVNSRQKIHNLFQN
ncbi:MAG: ABC transporter ATP-binding protein [Reichenbachiella sp.]